jgi:hypothetical protein
MSSERVTVALPVEAQANSIGVTLGGYQQFRMTGSL